MTLNVVLNRLNDLDVSIGVIHHVTSSELNSKRLEDHFILISSRVSSEST